VTNYLTSSNIAHNVSIVKGDSFSSLSEAALRIFIWFRQSNIGKSFICFERSIVYFNIGAKLFERCNFACLELSGYMFLRCK
jgi:hypothetical protein